MPPRYLSLAILGFWLATTGWLVYRDLWPRLRPGDPPPFSIDLADEAQHFALPTRWTIYRQDGQSDKQERLGRLRTWVEYRASDDTFGLHSEMERVRLALGLEVARLSSSYHVDRDGRLREMYAHLTASLDGIEVIQGQLEGQVQGQFFHATCRSEKGILDRILGKQEVKLTPVPVSASGTILNPLHPVNRIGSLQPGMQWRMPLVDPLTDALAATFPGTHPGPRFLDAQVLPEPKNLTWHGREVACLVIEYSQGNELSARTWVRQSDGLVLRQEANLQSEKLILQRE